MALKKVKGSIDRVLEKNLQDLVRGIRNHKEAESKYIAECIEEIKQELKQDNLSIKANAVSKLAYLQMLGYDISWAAFNIIEVMSSTKFTYKRMGYLAASQSFHEGTDVLMLTTNMIRKDLSSQNMFDAGVALTGLSCFMTCDLARDLANDIMTLMSSVRPYLRKKSILIMYKVFLKFPEALRPAFPRLKDKLEDPDQGVQSAAVNVICELARKNPQNYLSLAPVFFKLMTSSSNNWVLIKIIKLFGALTPLEPRLGKKLIEPLTNLIHSTSAMSLLYECINTVIAGVPNHSASIQLCVQKLRILIEDSDQNLKYLGLLAMSKILKTHPKSVQSHKDLILQCLDDKDESIRLRALDLLYGMVSKKNLMEIVKKLMVHMDKAEGSVYRDELLCKIIEICCQSNYQYITNFEWYVSILVELTRIEGTKHGKLIASQMLDVAIRVQAIRSFAVAQMAVLLENSHLLGSHSQRNGICEVLYAAAWICGEFSDLLPDPPATLDAMLKPKVTQLPGHIQSIYVQNLLKLYTQILIKAEEEENEEMIQQAGQTLIEKLPMFVQSADLEVQERACSVLQLMKYIMKLHEKGVKLSQELSSLFSGELNPVAPKAQRKVPVPEGLDLDAWINEPPSDSSDDEIHSKNIFGNDFSEHRHITQTEAPVPELTEEELERRRIQRRAQNMMNPHYLRSDGKPSNNADYHDLNNVNDIPVAKLDLNIPLSVPGLPSSDDYLQIHRRQQEQLREKRMKQKKKRKTKRSRRRHGNDEESDEDIQPAHQVSSVVDVPEGATVSDKEDHGNLTDDDPHRQLDINLDEPLRDDEILPVRTHRQTPATAENGDEESNVKHRSHRKKSKEKHGEKTKKEKHSEKKRSSKKSKKKRDHSSDAGANLLGDFPVGDPESSVKTPSEYQEPERENGKRTPSPALFESVEHPTAKTVDLSPVADVIAPPGGEEETKEEDKEQTHKKKKKKESKKEKKRKEKRKDKSEYEIADGITTPSKEVLLPTPQTTQLPPMSSYKLLGEDTTIKMMSETRVSPHNPNQVVLSVIFTNRLSNQIKDMELNVLDSLNTKLVREVGKTAHDPVKVPFILLPESQNEGQFAFTVDHINMIQRLRGTLTYIVKLEDGSTHEKLDFKINLLCSSFMMAIPCTGSSFAELLANGELSEKSSAKFTPTDPNFSHNVTKLCFLQHFSVVEQIPGSASLYSKSIQGHHVCLLIKQLSNGDLSVDAKSSDSSLISNLVDEVKTLLTQKQE
ncbi:AP-3 complex subunit delta-1-like isoform X2 [Tubulanus polymorphus]|uniref:AP-3 complex subunit delta-1-like isoform X2 n=1 Tax=Tubulanus polymorphus TaxID=672921 RepID=UPI003DA6980A